MNKRQKTLLGTIGAILMTGAPALADTGLNDLDAILEAREVPVTIDNFVRAATDIEMTKYVTLAGGVNQFFHFQAPTDVAKQPTIRMNRDTLYSTAVIDITKGATLTIPDVDGRYLTTMVVNQDHYVNDVFYGGGTFTLDMDTFDTPYVIVFMRILVDASDPEDIAEVNRLQDQMQVTAASDKPFLQPDYDEESFEGLLQSILSMGPYTPDSSRMFGAQDEVDGVRHLIGTAGGWGGLPEAEAFYLNVDPGLPVGAYEITVPVEVPVDAFWSISAYNAGGFFEPNTLGAYNINSVTGTRNDDGGMTVHLGDCDDGRPNCLPIIEGWNYTVRLYRPGPEVIDGSWTFPAAQSLK